MDQAGLTRPPHPEEEKKENGGRSKHSEQQEKGGCGLPEKSAKMRDGCPTQRCPSHTNLGLSGRAAFCIKKDIQGAKHMD